MSEPKDWSTIAIALTAGYGAVLSTITLAIHLWEKRKGIKVNFKWGITPEPRTGEVQTVISLEAINSGNKKMTLKNCFIKLPDGSSIVFLENLSLERTQFPFDLEPNSSVSYTVLLREIMKTIIERGHTAPITINAAYTDALDKEHLSDSVIIDHEIFKKYF